MTKSLKIQLGFRLFMAGCFLLMGNIVFAAIAAVAIPNLDYIAGRLATGISEDDQKVLLDTITKQVKDLVKESSKENITSEQLEKRVVKLNEDISKLTEEGIKKVKDTLDKLALTNEQLVKDLAKSQEETSKLNDALNKQGIELKKISDKGITTAGDKKTTFRQAMKEAIMKAKDRLLLKEVNDGESDAPRMSLKNFFEQNGQKAITPVMTIDKAPVDMLESAIVAANVNTVRMTELDPQRVGIPLTIYPHVIDVFPSKPINKKFMSLLVTYSYEDGAGTKTEGAAPSKSSLLLKTVEFASVVIATYATLSDETLDDLEEALDELSIVMPDKIRDNIDTQILGSAGDDITTIKGILAASKRTAFDSSNYLDSFDSATIIDVIAAAKLQAEDNKMQPSHVYLSPLEVTSIEAQKNTFDDSRNDRRVTFDALGRLLGICGLRVLKSTEIAENELLVIDMRQPQIGIRKGMTMEIGYNGTDFTEGQKTVTIKIRLAFAVRNPLGIIYVSNIHNAIADITVGS